MSRAWRQQQLLQGQIPPLAASLTCSNGSSLRGSKNNSLSRQRYRIIVKDIMCSLFSKIRLPRYVFQPYQYLEGRRLTGLRAPYVPEGACPANPGVVPVYFKGGGGIRLYFKMSSVDKDGIQLRDLNGYRIL